MEKFASINGKNLYYMFLAGAKNIIDNQADINKINVYPVADSDTGTNMASTIRTVIDSLKPDTSFKVTADAIGVAALTGARGNSGIIFAQFLYGFSEEITDCQDISISEFAESLKRSIKYLYEAIAHPVEGTILTVIREWVEFIHEQRDRFDDFAKLISESYEVATKSLAETTMKLAELARANVVDAGAKGFVLFLEGMMDLLRGKNIKQIVALSAETREGMVIENIPDRLPEMRYCTEAMIEGDNIDKRWLMGVLEQYGDSVVVAGSARKARIHVHTNNPADLFIDIRPAGKVTFQKVEDMVKQYESAYARKYRIAIVTDSTCDLPEEIISRYQIYQVPINMVVDGNHYLDGLTLKSDEFYKLQDLSAEQPSTSQPSRISFMNLYSQLATSYDSVIAIHLASKLSGTYNSSLQAAEKIAGESGKRIDVIDSISISGGLGLLVKRAAEMIDRGSTHDEIVSTIRERSKPYTLFVSIRTLEYFVRSGRVSPLKGRLAKALNLLPVISVGPEGKAELLQKAFSYNSNRRKVLENVRKAISNQTLYGYAITHVSSGSDAGYFINEMKSLTGKEPAFVSNVTPSLGLHTGKGTVAIAFQMK